MTIKTKKHRKRRRTDEGPTSRCRNRRSKIVPHEHDTKKHRKRRRTQGLTSRRRKRRCFDNKDRISELPDDIKLVIFSFLGIRDAGRTSVLSKTWRYSWNYNLDELDFDIEKTLGLSWLDCGRYPAQQYVLWVNKVISAHSAPTIKKFRVRHYLRGAYEYAINRWLNFCLKKGVQELELGCMGRLRTSCDNYFTFESMWQMTSLNRDVCVMPTFTNLRSFRAVAIKISAPLLELILSNCLLLEQLCVNWCKVDGSLKVVGPSLKLKYLKFKSSEVDKVEVSAPNLNTIVCWSLNGDLDHLECKSVPSLVDVTVGGYCAKYFINQISCCSSQLEKLLIDTSMVGLCSVAIPPLDKLKQLTLRIFGEDDDNLLYLTYLLDACPLLREFKLELRWFLTPIEGGRRKDKGNVYSYLEAVYVGGFKGCKNEERFISYLAKHAPALKAVTLDSRDMYDVKAGRESRQPHIAEASQRFAKRLAKKFSSFVNVEVI